ncbi:hypothetical protein DEU56DRAFT_759746 [Suillus clintonianus]|uniref:uncharacterized protein n=1 Tax=Suillus clintonianus TaxID=1904413 RepID=UPI001B86B081|nr:uncharacterized protein DEU56DRAFT_759746 [Suillus clintonianus]KAG2124215.1 hypothetical protein DEU56DRAFT_759746 [Suillus clintonianus]
MILPRKPSYLKAKFNLKCESGLNMFCLKISSHFDDDQDLDEAAALLREASTLRTVGHPEKHRLCAEEVTQVGMAVEFQCYQIARLDYRAYSRRVGPPHSIGRAVVDSLLPGFRKSLGKSRISLSDTVVSYETLQDVNSFQPSKSDPPGWTRVTWKDGSVHHRDEEDTGWHAVPDRWHRRSNPIIIPIASRRYEVVRCSW